LIAEEESRSFSKKSKIFPLFLIVLILGMLLFLTLNYTSAEWNIGEDKDAALEANHFLVKVLLKENGITNQELKITNNGDKSQEITLSSNFADLMFISENNFILHSGDTEELILEFSASNFEPGAYIGKLFVDGDRGSRLEIPIIIDIESPEVDFDNNVNFHTDTFLFNSHLVLPISIFNLVNEEPSEVHFEYFIKDINDRVVFEESEQIIVSTQSAFTKTISLDEKFLPGFYLFGAKTYFQGSTAVTSNLFEVIYEEPAKASFSILGLTCRGDNIFCTLSLVDLILLLFFLAILIYFIFYELTYGRGKGKHPVFEGSKLALYLVLSFLILVGLLVVLFALNIISYSAFMDTFSSLPLGMYLVLLLIILGILLYTVFKKRPKKKPIEADEELKRELEKIKPETKPVMPSEPEEELEPFVFDEEIANEEARQKERRLNAEYIPERRIELPIESFGGPTSGFDPWRKVYELINNTYKAFDNKKYREAEFNYIQIKPLFPLLSSEQRNHIYPYMIDLKRKMLLGKMSIFRGTLEKKKRKKKVKRKVKKKVKKKTKKKKKR